MKRYLLASIIVAAPLAWLLGGALVRDEAFVFRDAAHYYYPLYKYVAGQWAAGRVPLWNPQENLGQPLLADATSAVLYPGKLVFVLPCGYGTNFKLYVVGHVVLAAITSFIAARGFARSIPAATVCALSYALSGSVVFQYSNVPFLVSAAWLPLALLAGERTLARRSWKWAIGLAVTMAMMILGGDPQTAYHVMIVAGLGAVALPRVAGNATGRGILFHRITLLLIAAFATFLLTAGQIIPSAMWSRVSTRAAYDSPRSVYELAGSWNDREIDNRYGFLIGHVGGGHHLESYQFSVGPWHAADFVWPNCFGRVFPTNSRWIRALHAEGRTWTPSLYMGLLPVLLALSQLQFLGRARLPPSQPRPEARQESRPPQPESRRWLSWLVLLSLLAALGWYSLGWLAGEIYHAAYGADARDVAVGSPFGGVNWLLQSLLPGYAYFRYPAKWLVISAIGLSLLAAYGWDGLAGGSRRFVMRGLAAVFVGTFALLLVMIVIMFATDYWSALAGITPKDAYFGPLDVEAAGAMLLTALVHTALLSAVLWCATLAAVRCPQALWLLVLITAVDLAIAQAGLIATVPAMTITEPSTLAAQMRQASRPEDDSAFRNPGYPLGGATPRAYRRHWLPKAWTVTSSPDRQVSGAQFDRQTLFPRYSLLDDVALVESSSAMVSLDHQQFMHAAKRHKLLPAIGTQFIIGPKTDDDTQAIAHPLQAGPRAWIVHDVEVLPPLDSRNPSAVAQRTEQVLAPDGQPRDLTSLAIVESDQTILIRSDSSPVNDVEGREECTIVRDDSAYVVLQASLAQDGLVVLADTFTPDWGCEATDLGTGEKQPLPILRTNRVMRGVWLPAGEYELTFRYRPLGFYWGAGISLLAWIGVALLLATNAIRKRVTQAPGL